MKYEMTVEKDGQEITRVTLTLLTPENSSVGVRRFSCHEGEIMVFEVQDGQIIFHSHTTMPKVGSFLRPLG